MSDSPLDVSRFVDQPVARNVRAPAESAVRRQAGRRRDPVIRLDGGETDESVSALLRDVSRRFRWAAGARFARIVGNAFYYESAYELVSPQVDPDDDTISDVLGPGVVHLRPTDRRGLGVVQLAEGGAYEALRVLRDGRLEPTGIALLTRGLAHHPGGFLAYSAHGLYLPELVVPGRVPRDTQALAQSIANTMDAVTGGNRAILADAVLRLLTAREPRGEGDFGFEAITAEELMDVIRRLRRLGRLGAFLNLVAIPEFRDFLRSKDVDWAFIYANWQATIGDSGLLFSGFLIGAGQNVTDVAVLLGTLAGAALSTIVDHPYLEELARDTRRLVEAIKKFFEHPIANLSKGLKAAYRAFEEALWKLDFFEAGRMLGNATVMVLTLPEAIAALPRAARAALSGLGKLAALAADAVVALGIRLRDLLRALIAKGAEMVRVGANTIVLNGDRLVLAGPAGGPLGSYALATMIEDVNRVRAAAGARPLRNVDDLERLLDDVDIAQWEKSFDELFKKKPADPDAPGAPKKKAGGSKGTLSSDPAVCYVQVDELVVDGIAAVRKRFGSRWLNARDFGTALHNAIEDLLRKRYGAAAKADIAVERPLGEFAHVADDVNSMTIKEFIDSRSHYGLDEKALRRIFRDVDKQTIGNLKPDLVIETDAMRVVWDLTARSNTDHLAKTLFYNAVLDDGRKLTMIAETYWRHFRKDFNPFDFYGAGAAAAANKKAKKRAEADEKAKGDREPDAG